MTEDSLEAKSGPPNFFVAPPPKKTYPHPKMHGDVDGSNLVAKTTKDDRGL